MIKFSKISLANWQGTPEAYDSIELPVRSTAAAAGYDFKTPVGFVLNPGESFIVNTGIRAQMPSDTFLMILPRSGMGFKYHVSLNNTAGIIDSDYYNADNEGHIMIKLYNGGDKVVEINSGDKIAQGIFMKYLVTDDDSADGERHGGFGSTGC